MLLKFIGGDGDQSYMRNGDVAEVVSREWFSGTIHDSPALLVKMKTGDRSGEYLGFTSVYVASLESQIEEGFAGVVVHALENRRPNPVVTDESWNAVGKAALHVIE
jgi:hypothetical protein